MEEEQHAEQEQQPEKSVLEELESGSYFEREELEQMGKCRVFRVKVEHAWIGRVRPQSKLRQIWRFCFTPRGREHMIELVASARSGKREVLFDKKSVLPAEKCSPLLVKMRVPHHTFVLEEASTFKFSLIVDGVAFFELEDVNGIVSARAADAVEDDDDVEKEEEKDESKTGGKHSVVASNALVSLYQVQLEPGVFGTGILLRNEPCASRRIEVAALASRTSVPGVVPGDVLVAINGKPLPRGASATELQELVRSNPRYALTAVDALMWHNKVVERLPRQGERKSVDFDDDDDDGIERLAGSELTINCGNGALGVEWARMVWKADQEADYLDGLFAAVGIRGQALHLAVKTGDILIGIGHEPLPKNLPSATLLQRFSSAAARGPPTLNLWRCYDPPVLKAILAQCDEAKKHSLCVNPSVSAQLPRRSRENKPSSNTCC